MFISAAILNGTPPPARCPDTKRCRQKIEAQRKALHVLKKKQEPLSPVPKDVKYDEDDDRSVVLVSYCVGR